jgi:hypothetical protein
MSSQHVLKAARLSRVCVLFLSSWTVCLTVWIIDARCTVLEATLLNVGRGTEEALITVAAQRHPGYKYLICSPLETISHSFSSSSSCLGFLSLSCSLLFNNGGQESHQERMLSLHRGTFSTQRRQDSVDGVVWVSTTTRISLRGLFTPPSLTGV